MQEIKVWIRGKQDYAAGLDLYRKYGKNAITLMQLEAAVHSLNIKLLCTELTQLSNTSEQDLATKQHTISPAPIEKSVDMDEAIKPFYILKAKLYREAGQMHAIELWSENDAVRAKAAVDIMQRMDENGVCWDTIRYYEKHGFLPHKEKGYEYLDTKSPLELIKLRNNNRAYISKTTKKLGAMEEQDERYRAFQTEIERRENENEAIAALNKI